MMLMIYTLLSHGILSLGTPIVAVLALAWGYWFSWDCLHWVDHKIKDYLQRR